MGWLNPALVPPLEHQRRHRLQRHLSLQHGSRRRGHLAGAGLAAAFAVGVLAVAVQVMVRVHPGNGLGGVKSLE